MESIDIINKLKNAIKQLKLINSTSLSLPQERTNEIKEKESVFLTKIVGCFNEILSDNIINKNKQTSKEKEKKNNYWSFISRHFNSPLVRFCIINDETEIKNNKDENFLEKGENWILLSILEKSFCDSINEIYKKGLDELYYTNNALLRKNKKDIIDILTELNQIHFDYVKNKDYENYLNYLEKNPRFGYNESGTDSSFPLTPQSPIPEISPKPIIFSNVSMIPMLTNMDGDAEAEYEEYNFFRHLSNNLPINQEEKDFCSEKLADFAPSVIDNFYTFLPNSPKNDKNNKKNEDKEEQISDIKTNLNNNSIINKDSDSVDNSSKISEEELKLISNLVLNPKKTKFLPTDKLYEINEKSSGKKYNKNDKLIYNKKRRPISNCLLLYLNNYYKKSNYHKFYKHNLHNKPITLKEQNYQCYICLKKFSLIFGIPTEEIFWCSYYMRFVCKNCIDDEFSIIPHFILDKWCFKKFSISKKAKITLMKWYDKPVIIFKKKDILLKKIPQLYKIIEIKKIINNIFDIMKCEDKFKFLKDNLGEYEYIALKEYIFSVRDLVEINNKTFYKKINQFKKKLISHISGDCPICKFEGEICSKCCNDKKIFFYDIENVFYCKICRKSYHKKCIGLVGHFH